jgi:hypothetical protein
MSLVGDIVLAPSLPEAQLATRKGEVITMLRQDEDNPGVRATEALMEMLYPPRMAAAPGADMTERPDADLADLHAHRAAERHRPGWYVDADGAAPLRLRRVFVRYRPLVLPSSPAMSRRRVDIPENDAGRRRAACT